MSNFYKFSATRRRFLSVASAGAAISATSLTYALPDSSLSSENAVNTFSITSLYNTKGQQCFTVSALDARGRLIQELTNKDAQIEWFLHVHSDVENNVLSTEVVQKLNQHSMPAYIESTSTSVAQFMYNILAANKDGEQTHQLHAGTLSVDIQGRLYVKAKSSVLNELSCVHGANPCINTGWIQARVTLKEDRKISLKAPQESYWAMQHTKITSLEALIKSA